MFHDLILLKNLNLNQSKFFRTNSLPFWSIMISTHLFIFWRKYWRSLTKVYISFFFKLNKLPLNEWIVIWVHLGCYEWSRVIYMNTELVQMLLTQRREISNPMSWVNKFYYLLIWDIHHFKQIILEVSFLHILWENWWITVHLQLVRQLNGGCADRHTCAMETEREQYIISAKSFIPSIEVAFSHWKSMTKMQQSVHIGIWESFKEFRFFVGLNCKVLISLPDISGSLFQCYQFVSSYCTFLLWFHDISAK